MRLEHSRTKWCKISHSGRNELHWSKLKNNNYRSKERHVIPTMCKTKDAYASSMRDRTWNGELVVYLQSIEHVKQTHWLKVIRVISGSTRQLNCGVTLCQLNRWLHARHLTAVGWQSRWTAECIPQTHQLHNTTTIINWEGLYLQLNTATKKWINHTTSCAACSGSDTICPPPVSGDLYTMI